MLRGFMLKSGLAALAVALLLTPGPVAAQRSEPQRSEPQRAAPAKQPPAQQQRQQPSETDPRTWPRIDAEAVLHNQHALIDQSIAALTPSDPTETNLYFVGFAGFATQDVFIREVVQARDIVEERLGARGRTLLLVNHPAAIDDVPLASVSNLDAMLGKLARVMNPDKDVLMLFLTSHGQPGLFAVYFPGFPLNHATPEAIAASLDRSGIKHRVIVISACYSGSFVPALSRPGNLVMTASRADRNSFGCSNENLWTYFGDAFFNRGLRASTSLTGAFEIARAQVRDWEAQEKLIPSEPQIFVGETIRPLIERLAKRPPAALPAN